MSRATNGYTTNQSPKSEIWLVIFCTGKSSSHFKAAKISTDVIFNTVSYYLLFLLPAAIIFRRVRDDWRPLVCIAAGGGFFLFYSIRQFGGYFGAACLLMFVWEAIFSRLYKKGSIFCWIGVIQAVVFLGVFKYWNFFTRLIFHFQGQDPLLWKNAFLPLGISFFTFEFIHYAVDRYKGKTEAGRMRDYLAFILFFPTMVAGPIKRYQDFLPNLLQPSKNFAVDWNRGVTRILCGLFKKFAIADVLTALTDHLNRTDISAAPRWILPVWILAYGIHIYFDFSGYSDIAIGSARLFGLMVKENFNWPYLQTNIADFWGAWHITLYRWLIDYIFIPLGGSRVRPILIYRNVLVTMLISGLWHGAGLNFVAWGLWHGILLCGHRLWKNWRTPSATPPAPAVRFLSWAFTFTLVNLGWAFFCMDIHTALFFFYRLFIG
jgi:alginate O-acetyltransferase complex protein AlgI